MTWQEKMLRDAANRAKQTRTLNRKNNNDNFLKQIKYKKISIIIRIIIIFFQKSLSIFFVIFQSYNCPAVYWLKMQKIETAKVLPKAVQILPEAPGGTPIFK